MTINILIQKVSEEDKRKTNKIMWMSWLEQYKARLLKEVDGLSDTDIDKVHLFRVYIV